MKRFTAIAAAAAALFAFGVLSLTRAAEEAVKKDPETRIKAALAKLPDSDRKLVETQRYCAVETQSRLGSMGAPVKLEVGGKFVFLCCAGCEEAALADSKATVASADKLKKVTAALGKLSEKDRAVAERQRFCPVTEESRLGSMGTPIRIEIAGKPVFLCCEGCRDSALEDPSGTLKKAEQLGKAKATNKKVIGLVI